MKVWPDEIMNSPKELRSYWNIHDELSVQGDDTKRFKDPNTTKYEKGNLNQGSRWSPRKREVQEKS